MKPTSELHFMDVHTRTLWNICYENQMYPIFKKQIESYESLLRVLANNSHDSGESDSMEDLINNLLAKHAKQIEEAHAR